MHKLDDIEALTDLLKRERKALLVADFKTLEALVPRKVALFEKMSTLDLPEGRLRDLQTDIGRNQDLLRSAMEGIKVVSARLKDARTARAGLNMYDGQGRARHVACPSGPSFEKRA